MKKNIFDIFDDIENREEEFLQSSFLSPILKNNKILVSIGGLIYKFRVGKPEAGWHILQPQNKSRAKIIRVASYAERAEYLKLFKRVFFIPIFVRNNILYCYPKSNSDCRFGAYSITPIYLADIDLVDTFDVIQARFDDQNYWFEEIDFNFNPQKAAYLRECLDNLVEPINVHLKGTTPHELNAYSIALELKKQAEADISEIILRNLVEKADAKFIDYTENKSQFKVRYSIQGKEQPLAIVTKDGFNVVSSGVCLTNEGVFDLTSLVSVMKERQVLGGNPEEYAWHREWGTDEYYGDEEDDY